MREEDDFIELNRVDELLALVDAESGNIESSDVADILVQVLSGGLQETNLSGDGLDGISHDDLGFKLLSSLELLARLNGFSHKISRDLQVLEGISRDGGSQMLMRNLLLR